MNKTDVDKLLAQVPEDGSSVGNTTLRSTLGWEPDKYFRVRQQLLDNGQLELGRGRGGSVRRTVAVASAPAPAPDDKVLRERDLYKDFGKALEVWVKDKGWTHSHIEETADGGGRPTGGRWTRPDFVVLGVSRYDFTPGITRDVETFEIKLPKCGVQAVFETASHSRAATKSHLAILHKKGAEDDDLERIESECQRFGLGLILFERAGDLKSWEYRVDPIRREPDPALLDEFIKTQVRGAEQFRKWLK